uniref:Alpha,alpha-trehalose-phosphate synthase (UDP-forming) n=1 Tax=Aureoumbra lagunensis TaxID=44058 RepID=A0A7S3K0H0_9STRA
MRAAVGQLLKYFYDDDDDDDDDDGNDDSDVESVANDVLVKRDLSEIQESQVLEQLQELHKQLAQRRLERKEQFSAARNEASRADGRDTSKDTVALPEGGKNKKIIFCAVHKPVRLEKAHGVDQYAYRKSVGGISSAAQSLERYGIKVRWVSWPGACHDPSSRDGVRKKLDETYNTRAVFFDREAENNFYVKFCHGILWPLFHCIPSPGLTDAAGIGSRSGVQSSKFESRRTPGNFRSASDQFEAYARANQLFLEAVAEEYESGDIVIVYDYQLMLLPALLRKRFPEIAIAFFCHCPFPSSEFYRMLPAREDLLRGVLGADLVSFNHFDFVRHFRNACMRVLGLEASQSRLEYNGRLVAVSICPVGINPDDYIDVNQEETNIPETTLDPDETQSDDTQEEERADDMARRLRQGVFRDRKILICVASLDMSKGIPQALLAMDALLTTKPEWRGIATLVLAARDLGGPHNKQLRTAVDGLVGHVNGKYGRADYCPVLYVKHTLKRHELLALYSMADVALVASVRQGLNTPALEFVACQSAAISDVETNKTLFDVGVLVYSEFAGSASSFEDGAILVNPYDADAVARALHRALTMPRTAKHIKLHHLARYINTYTADLWGRRLLRELSLARQKASEYTRLLPLDVARLRSFYERSKKRLLVLEHGALSKSWQLAGWPSFTPALRDCLFALCSDPANTVYVLSGQPREQLDEVDVLELGLVAEFGFWLRRPIKIDSFFIAPVSSIDTPQPNTLIPTNLAKNNEDIAFSQTNSQISSPPSHRGEYIAKKDFTNWEQIVPNPVDLDWIHEILPILEDFTRQTPGAVLQVHASSLVWQYRDADADFGAAQAKDLQLHLDLVSHDRPVRIVPLPSKQCIVFQPSSVSKGRALRAALNPIGGFDAFDLVFAVGDERADDDIFDALDNSSHAFTCTLGRRLSRAAYFLDHDEVIPTLQTLAAVSTNLFHASSTAGSAIPPASPSSHSITSPPAFGSAIQQQRKHTMQNTPFVDSNVHLPPPAKKPPAFSDDHSSHYPISPSQSTHPAAVDILDRSSSFQESTTAEDKGDKSS